MSFHFSVHRAINYTLFPSKTSIDSSTAAVLLCTSIQRVLNTQLQAGVSRCGRFDTISTRCHLQKQKHAHTKAGLLLSTVMPKYCTSSSVSGSCCMLASEPTRFSCCVNAPLYTRVVSCALPKECKAGTEKSHSRSSGSSISITAVPGA